MCTGDIRRSSILDTFGSMEASDHRRAVSHVPDSSSPVPSHSARNQVDWEDLRGRVDGRLIPVRSPIEPCISDASSPACSVALQRLQNPYFIEDEPGAFHTTGWLGAFRASPSPYAVAAETAEDLATAVTFARDHGLGLAVKGTGHDYLGRSCADDALLLWTRHMSETTVHDAFRPTGAAAGIDNGVPAVTVGAGTTWLEVYQKLAESGRYVQGGGCTTVGAAGGFTQGGGFGSFSRRFGTAAGNVLEVEVVTASGEIVVANAFRHPDLFWALRGGGGGTFGVVSKVTMRTHPMPETMGAVAGTIRAARDEDFRALIDELVRLYPKLCDDHWGEQIRLSEDNSAEISMIAVDLEDDQAQAVWAPFLRWVDDRPDSFASDVFVVTIPFDRFWDHRAWDELAPEMIHHDDRPGQPRERYWWAANQGEVSQFLNAYQSRWLPRQLFDEAPGLVADALFDASRHWHFSMHANKALSGASPDAIERERHTSINPAVFEAACLLIAASNQQSAFPGVAGYEPDTGQGAVRAGQVHRAMEAVRAATPGSGSYVNEADYFEPDWQESFWGGNLSALVGDQAPLRPDQPVPSPPRGGERVIELRSERQRVRLNGDELVEHLPA